MSGNPRENAKNKGFWDGGSRRHGSLSESAGKTTGFPGERHSGRAGVRVEIDSGAHVPEEPTASETSS